MARPGAIFITEKLPQAAHDRHLSDNNCRSAVELWRSQCGSTEGYRAAEGRQPDYLAHKNILLFS